MLARTNPLVKQRSGRSSAASFWLQSIRSRLYLAFGVAATMTVVGSAFSLFALTNISKTMTEIVTRSIPETVESLRLSEEASALVSSGTFLMSANNDSHRDEIARAIASQSKVLTSRIERLRALDAGHNDDITNALSKLVGRLDTLNSAVTERINLSVQRQALAVSVRKYHDAFLEAITPIIDDANFDLMMRDRSSGTSAALSQSIKSLRRLLEIQAGVNLLTGLLVESSMIEDVAKLPPLRDLIGSAKRNIEAHFRALPEFVKTNNLSQLYQRLASAAGDNGIIILRANELKREQDAKLVFKEALANAAELRHAVDGLIERQRDMTRTLSAHALDQFRLGQILLLVLIFVALVAAFLIAWLYVGRSIASRLALLSSAMGRIAQGEENVPVPVSGRDEIAGMAQALLVFRKAMTEVTSARQSEAERAEQSEVRQQQVEAATRKFEGAVNDIVQALDDASKSMDVCAHLMTEAADHNRNRADDAASASEEATLNVSNVAMAAEEIAQSVEQISREAAISAHNAKLATDEAKNIINAVEQLAASVGQINNVSNLIRDVAAQTNLLALNATIEAARAGNAGRGFAVVAQEVKCLAAQTEKATGDITEKILSIEQTTRHVVQAMNAIAGTIAQLDENARDISIAVQQQDAVSKEIASSASVAADRTREVSASVLQVSSAAAKTEQVASSVLNAGAKLATRSRHLQTEVQGFLAQVRVA